MIPSEEQPNYSTVDKLPLGASTRRARDMESRGPNLREAPNIAGRAQIDVTSPAYPTQSSLLMGNQARNKPFSVFFPPPKYNRQTRNFTHLIIPSLGDGDRLRSNKEKLDSLQNLSEPERAQCGKLTAFFSTMSTLTDILRDIEGSMNQFKRG